MSGFIPDGFTDSFYLEGVPRLHEPVRGRYRPCTTEETSEYYASAQLLKPREQDRHAAKLVAAHVVSWDLKDPATGDTLPIKQEVVLRLTRRLFFRLLSIVTGTEPPDEDPQASDSHSDRQELAADRKEAAAKGEPFRPGA